MKFEIEEDLVVIDTGEGFTELVRAQDLETILQAVKKTQEKLVNKQIQEIQDSKNMTISQPKFEIDGDNIHLEGENVSIQATDPKQNSYLTIKCTEDHEKIEQNQKIVDELIKRYKSVKGHDFQGDEIADELNHVFNNATGKWLEDL